MPGNALGDLRGTELWRAVCAEAESPDTKSGSHQVHLVQTAIAAAEPVLCSDAVVLVASEDQFRLSWHAKLAGDRQVLSQTLASPNDQGTLSSGR